MTGLLPDPLQSRLQPWMERWRPADALLPLSIALHTYKSSRVLGVGLLVIWLGWRLTVALLEAGSQGDSGTALRPTLSMFLGLLLVNARPISLRDDVQGPSQFLLIALGFVVGSQLLPRAWRATLGWLALSVVPLLLQFVLEALATGQPISIGQIETIYTSTMRGHGSINRLATLALMLTLCGWSFTLLTRGLVARILGGLCVGIGYLLCLGSGSRTAIYGAPLAAILAWGWLRLQGRRNRFVLRFLLATAGTLVSLLTWWFLLSPDAARNRLSDLFRFEAASCWLSMMFSGRNRFVWGVGYGSETANRICHHIPDFRGQLGTIGHAHNTIAHIAGQHGLLGLIALLILCLLVVIGLRAHLASIRPLLPLPLGLGGATWTEATLAINLALALNALATTIHTYHQINQVLIGLLAATALHPLSQADDGSAASAPAQAATAH